MSELPERDRFLEMLKKPGEMAQDGINWLIEGFDYVTDQTNTWEAMGYTPEQIEQNKEDLKYEIATGIVTFIAFWVVLFTGKYPRGMFGFVVGFLRWSFNLWTHYAYLLHDEYPPFSNEQKAGYPVTLGIEYPERLSRAGVVLKVLLGWLYVGIPHGIILALYGIVTSIVAFITFWAILFTEKYPRGMFDFVSDGSNEVVKPGSVAGTKSSMPESSVETTSSTSSPTASSTSSSGSSSGSISGGGEGVGASGGGAVPGL